MPPKAPVTGKDVSEDAPKGAQYELDERADPPAPSEASTEDAKNIPPGRGPLRTAGNLFPRPGSPAKVPNPFAQSLQALEEDAARVKLAKSTTKIKPFANLDGDDIVVWFDLIDWKFDIDAETLTGHESRQFQRAMSHTVMALLDGDPADFVATIDIEDRSCYKTLRSMLLERYRRRIPTQREKSRVVSREINALRQGAMTLAEYVARGHDLRFKCTKDAQLELLKDCFLEGLNDTTMAGFLRMTTEDLSWDDTVARLKIFVGGKWDGEDVKRGSKDDKVDKLADLLAKKLDLNDRPRRPQNSYSSQGYSSNNNIRPRFVMGQSGNSSYAYQQRQAQYPDGRSMGPSPSEYQRQQPPKPPSFPRQRPPPQFTPQESLEDARAFQQSLNHGQGVANGGYSRNVMCWVCGARGHMQSECRSPTPLTYAEQQKLKADFYERREARNAVVEAQASRDPTAPVIRPPPATAAASTPSRQPGAQASKVGVNMVSTEDDWDVYDEVYDDFLQGKEAEASDLADLADLEVGVNAVAIEGLARAKGKIVPLPRSSKPSVPVVQVNSVADVRTEGVSHDTDFVTFADLAHLVKIASGKVKSRSTVNSLTGVRTSSVMPSEPVLESLSSNFTAMQPNQRPTAKKLFMTSCVLRPLEHDQSFNVPSVLLDGGSSVDLISKKCVEELGLFTYTDKPFRVKVADGKRQLISEYVRVPIRVAGVEVLSDLYVMPCETDYHILLGLPWMERVKCIAFYGTQTFIIFSSAGKPRRILPQDDELAPEYSPEQVPEDSDAPTVEMEVQRQELRALAHMLSTDLARDTDPDYEDAMPQYTGEMIKNRISGKGLRNLAWRV